ncbi:Lrp/AsnC ligand binding domain-containing protein [Candidatus Woesearchaeota archaeon]|nr:Lrp/AsnC ligand binding domain-containing protein [Candidatus Woesearchaeota archaeon]
MFAYILVSLREAHERGVLDDFLGFESVVEGHILFGEWDLILKLKGSDADDIATFIMENIRSHDDVRLTSTLIVAK